MVSREVHTSLAEEPAVAGAARPRLRREGILGPLGPVVSPTEGCRLPSSSPAEKSHSVGTSCQQLGTIGSGGSELLAAAALYRVTADKRLRHTPLMSFI